MNKSVNGFLDGLQHPRRAEIDALREVIRSADPRLVESVKWNAPSFALEDHFATLQLRATDAVSLVLHTGAKVRPTPIVMAIDAGGLRLKWAAPDRCVATFASEAEIAASAPALVAVLRQWIDQL